MSDHHADTPASTTPDYDLVIIGGGINGAGIARDAAGRGLRVLLCEQADLAGHTSSASTKLIHGGLRYLEYYEFGLVRKALREREILWRIAPHIIWPLRFVMPHARSLRPAWLIRAGLLLYDHLGGRKRLPASRGINLARHAGGKPLADTYKRGFIYSDCWAQDARLVVLNAMDARQHGATIMPRTRCVSANRAHGQWQVTLQPVPCGEPCRISAAALVNAAGPWVARTIEDTAHMGTSHNIQLVKGSHIVLPRLFEHDHAYLFQHTDGRVIFAIPYEQDFTLIGTTDVSYSGDPAAASASTEEIAYLCDAVNRYLRHPIRPNDVLSTYSGVRALYDEHENDNAAAVSRDYMLDLQGTDSAPLLSVFGGKITTYRTLSEQAVDRLLQAMGHSGQHWTGAAPLPGGGMPGGDVDRFVDMIRRQYPWLPDAMLLRLTRNYGTCIRHILADADSLDDLGAHFGHGLYAAELRYLTQYEWARTAR